MKGWFLGFQPNTNKNYIIYHPQHTPSQGYKWILSFTPHVTFNEDVMFCEKSEHQSQYQSSDYLNSTLNFPSPNYQASIPLTAIGQPAPQVEGEYEPHPLEDVATDHQVPLSEDITTELSQSQEIINDLISHETTPITSPIISPTHPIATESNPLLPREAQNPSQPASIIDEFSIAELTAPSSPTQPTQLQLSYPLPNDEQTQPHDEEVLPYQLDIYHQQHKPIIENNITDIINITEQPTSQGEQRLEEIESDTNDEPLDFLMTGWEPPPSLAGQKRPHSPENEIVKTRSGRKVKKYDYSLLHHGRIAHALSDPSTWEEAITSPEATQWKIAAAEEFRSLKDTGTIEIIPRHKLPKGRKPMKCKWVFKKKYNADGSVDRWKARARQKVSPKDRVLTIKKLLLPLQGLRLEQLCLQLHTN